MCVILVDHLMDRTGEKRMNILMVLTSHSDLGGTGRKTGFWLEEFAAPYYVLTDAGATLPASTIPR